MTVSMLLLFLSNVAIAQESPEEPTESEKTDDGAKTDDDVEADDGAETETTTQSTRYRPVEEERTLFDGFRVRAKMGLGRYGFLQKEKEASNNQILPVDTTFIATTIPLDFDMEVLVKNMVTIDASIGLSPYRLAVVDENSLRQLSGYSIGAKYRYPVTEQIFLEGGLSYGSIGTFAFVYDDELSDVELDRTSAKGTALRTAAITSMKGIDLRLSLEEYFSPLPTNTRLVAMGDYTLQSLQIPMIDSELLLSAAVELDWHHFPYTNNSETVAIRGFQRNLLFGAGILW